MPIKLNKLNLISILSNPYRWRILEECTNVDIGIDPERTKFGLLQHRIKLKSYSALWEHIRILHEAGLIEIYDYTPEKHPIGVSTFKIITPAITKAKLNEIKKEIKRRKRDLEEIEKLVKKANIKFETMYKNPKTKKIFKRIK